ncbi:MAG TPA: AMP-dependent synthetase/ligase [Geobacteraceae bacterium]
MARTVPMTDALDIIDPQTAVTIPGLFRERVRRTPGACAYKRFVGGERCCDSVTWREVYRLAARWQEALRRETLQPGDRVAVMLKNGLEWVLFDLAALGLGLVIVPLFVNDRPENFAFILAQTKARLLLIEGKGQWQRIEDEGERLPGIERIVTLEPVCDRDCDPRLTELAAWLPPEAGEYRTRECDTRELATIVYTSGTTGNPKGVMLSHANILANAFAGLQRVAVYPDDLFLSFLPLSHTLERTVGYYVPLMAGACVAHVRSIERLAEDLVAVRPTILISVPRIFERIDKKITGELDGRPLRRHLFYLAVEAGWKRFLRRQGRGAWSPLFLLYPFLARIVARRVMAGFGGRVRVAISGGAPLAPAISRIFIGLGLNLLQGYGLTETSPVVAVNATDDNLPATVGRPLPGVETRVADDGELLIRGPSVMLGYWENTAATAAAIDQDGWFHSGDRARIGEHGHITITGRLKEIIVLSTGEKIAPEELEIAIAASPLFEQVAVVGEGRPFLAALVVLNKGQWESLAADLGIALLGADSLAKREVEEALLARIDRRLARFPGYARIRRVHAMLAPWRVEEGLITATLKLRRRELQARLAREVEALYAGH